MLGNCCCCCCARAKAAKNPTEVYKLSAGAGDQLSSKYNNYKVDMSSLIHSVEDKDDFDNQLKEAGSKLVVVDFYATWCGPCKMIAPKLEEMAQQFTDVIFLKVDVDEVEEVASQYGISCMPTFMFIKKSEKVAEFSGANADKLKEIIVQNK